MSQGERGEHNDRIKDVLDAKPSTQYLCGSMRRGKSSLAKDYGILRLEI